MGWNGCRSIWLAIVSVTGCVLARAQIPTPGLGEYTLQSWRVAEGLPQSSVNAMVQTDDHYLWLGTHNGLVRFDGFSFTVFGLEHGLKSTQITALLKDGNDLWIGTLGGRVTRYEHGRFDTFTTRDGLPHKSVVGLASGWDGTRWIATLGGLACWQAGKLERVPLGGIGGDQLRCLLADDAGTVLITTSRSGLLRLKNGQVESVSTNRYEAGLRLRPLVRGRAGDLWVGCQSGNVLHFAPDGSPRAGLSPADGLPADDIWAMALGANENLWIGFFNGGLAVRREGGLAALTEKEGLLSNSIRAIAEDRDGNIWVGTTEGLQRLSPRKVALLDATDDLSRKHICAISQARDERYGLEPTVMAFIDVTQAGTWNLSVSHHFVRAKAVSFVIPAPSYCARLRQRPLDWF